MILGLVLLVASMVLYFEFILPVYDEVLAIKAQKLGREEFLNGKKSIIKQVQSLIDTYEGQGQVQQVVSLTLPAEEDIGGAIAQLNGLARNSGFIVRSLSISTTDFYGGEANESGNGENSAAVIQKPIGRVSISASMAGSYDNLKSFISLLETNVRIFDLENLAISPNLSGNKGSAQDIFEYSLGVVTYYQKR